MARFWNFSFHPLPPPPFSFGSRGRDNIIKGPKQWNPILIRLPPGFEKWERGCTLFQNFDRRNSRKYRTALVWIGSTTSTNIFVPEVFWKITPKGRMRTVEIKCHVFNQRGNPRSFSRVKKCEVCLGVYFSKGKDGGIFSPENSNFLPFGFLFFPCSSSFFFLSVCVYYILERQDKASLWKEILTGVTRVIFLF